MLIFHTTKRQVDGSDNVEKDGATNLSIHRNVSFLYLEVRMGTMTFLRPHIGGSLMH